MKHKNMYNELNNILLGAIMKFGIKRIVGCALCLLLALICTLPVGTKAAEVASKGNPAVLKLNKVMTCRSKGVNKNSYYTITAKEEGDYTFHFYAYKGAVDFEIYNGKKVLDPKIGIEEKRTLTIKKIHLQEGKYTIKAKSNTTPSRYQINITN